MPTVEAAPGHASANSFLTVAEGDALAAEHLYASAWTAATETQKQAAAISATRRLVAECYTGVASTTEQALPWPRTGMLSRNGYALAGDIIPHDLKLATFELATLMLASDTEADLEQAVQGLTKIKAGPVELGFREGLDAARGLPGRVKTLLVPGWLCANEEDDMDVFRVL